MLLVYSINLNKNEVEDNFHPRLIQSINSFLFFMSDDMCNDITAINLLQDLQYLQEDVL